MDFSALSNLGTGAIAIYVMWLMYRSAQDARQRNDERLDKRDEIMRLLEADVRNKFSAQLMENTNSMIEHSKIMQKVVDILYKLK